MIIAVVMRVIANSGDVSLRLAVVCVLLLRQVQNRAEWMYQYNNVYLTYGRH